VKRLVLERRRGTVCAHTGGRSWGVAEPGWVPTRIKGHELG
jgi:hypothetical protein